MLIDVDFQQWPVVLLLAGVVSVIGVMAVLGGLCWLAFRLGLQHVVARRWLQLCRPAGIALAVLGWAWETWALVTSPLFRKLGATGVVVCFTVVLALVCVGTFIILRRDRRRLLHGRPAHPGPL